MTGALSLWVFCAAAFLTISAAGLLVVRGASARRAWTSPGRELPLALRLSWAPALLLAPAVSRFALPGVLDKARRRLAAEQLTPVMGPEIWLAMRCGHGAMLAVVASGASLALGFGVVLPAAVAAVVGFGCGGIWLRRRRLQRMQSICRELPAFLDLLTVAIEAGSTLTAGIRLVIENAPPSPLRRFFERVLREIRGGRPRVAAFASVAEIYDMPQLTALATALIHGEAAGMSLGGVLRTQGAQRTAERFARAEQLAMQAPVKLLGPLILCVFPCTFIVLSVPIVVRLLEAFAP